MDGQTNYLFEKPSMKPIELKKLELLDIRIKKTISKMRCSDDDESTAERKLQINKETKNENNNDISLSSDRSILKNINFDA